jgi:hypothetical protein
MKDTGKVVAKGFALFLFVLIGTAMLIHGKDTYPPMTPEQTQQQFEQQLITQQTAFDKHAISKHLIPSNSSAYCNRKDEIIGYQYSSSTGYHDPVYFLGNVFDNLDTAPCW